MKPNTTHQFEIWEKAYLAALAGFSAVEIVKNATSTADRALFAYVEKAAEFKKATPE